MPGYPCSVDSFWGSKEKKHCFPNPAKYLLLLKKWVKLCNNKKLQGLTPQYIYKSCRVCSLHFEPSDFGPNRRLLRTAYPKLELPERQLASPIDLESTSPRMLSPTELLSTRPSALNTGGVFKRICHSDNQTPIAKTVTSPEVESTSAVGEKSLDLEVEEILAAPSCKNPFWANSCQPPTILKEKKSDSNVSFANYIAAALAEMPKTEQNFAKLKIIRILNEALDPK